jgi:hypothetical protein
VPPWRVAATSLALLVVLTVLGVAGLAVAGAVPDRWVADGLHAARVEGSLTNTAQEPGRLGRIGDHFTECITLSVGLGDPPEAGMFTAAAEGTHLGPCDRLVAALDEYDRTGRLPEGTGYLRYWHGASVVARPIVALAGLPTLRLLSFLFMLGAGAGLARRVATVAGPVAALGLLGPLALTTDVLDLGTVATHALPLGIALCGAWFVLAITVGGPTPVRAWFASLLAGAAYVYVDLLTNVPGAWILVVAMTVLAARHRGLGPAGALRTGLAGAVGWGTGWAGLWFGKWCFAAAVLGRDRVVDDVGDTIGRRVGGDSPWADDRVGAAIESNVDHWLEGPLAWPVLVLAALVLVRALRRSAASGDLRVVAVATAPALLPFLWFELASNHSQVHHWFTYRSIPLALGVVLLAVLTRSSARNRDGSPVLQ